MRDPEKLFAGTCEPFGIDWSHREGFRLNFCTFVNEKTQKGLPLKSDHACSRCDKIMTRCPIWIIFCLNHIRITRATWFSELGFWGRLSRPPDCREHKWRRKNVGILGPHNWKQWAQNWLFSPVFSRNLRLGTAYRGYTYDMYHTDHETPENAS